MTHPYKPIIAATIALLALISTAQAETFHGKVVLADKPDEPVVGATVQWHPISKGAYGSGIAKTNENGEFKVAMGVASRTFGMGSRVNEQQGIFELLVLVFNKEGTHSLAAVLTPGNETTLKLVPGKSVTCSFTLRTTERNKGPTPIADLSLSLHVITGVSGNSMIRQLPDSFQQQRTDAEGNITFANLPQKPEQEGLSEFMYYLSINNEVMVNGVKRESMSGNFRPIDFERGSSTFVLSPSELQLYGWDLMQNVFNQNAEPQPQRTLLQNIASVFTGGGAPRNPPPSQKKQLLIIYNPATTEGDMNEGDTDERKLHALLSLLFYDPEISPIFHRYHVRGIRTKKVIWEKGDNDEYTQKVADDKTTIDFLKKLDKSLENLGELTFCVLDEKGKFLLSLPYEKVVTKTMTRQGEETEAVIPGLLLPFLEAFAE